MKRTSGAMTPAAPAHGASLSITPVKACYLTGDTLTLSGVGFSQLGSVDVKQSARSAGRVQTDQGGGFTGTFTFGTMTGVETRTISAQDLASPGLSASLSVMGSQHDVALQPQFGRTTVPRWISATGFTPGATLYVHVRRRGYRARRTLGALSGPCGALKTRIRLFRSSARSGIYTVQFDTSRRYSPKTPDRVRYRVRVFRTVGP